MKLFEILKDGRVEFNFSKIQQNESSYDCFDLYLSPKEISFLAEDIIVFFQEKHINTVRRTRFNTKYSKIINIENFSISVQKNYRTITLSDSKSSFTYKVTDDTKIYGSFMKSAKGIGYYCINICFSSQLQLLIELNGQSDKRNLHIEEVINQLCSILTIEVPAEFQDMGFHC